jgi:hypothetical protein
MGALLDGDSRALLSAVTLWGSCWSWLGFDLLYQLVPEWLGLPPPIPEQIGPPLGLKLDNLKGLRDSIGYLFENPIASLVFSLGIVVFLLLCRIVLRKPWLAIAGFMVLTTIPGIPPGVSPILYLVYSGLTSALCLIILFRFGLLPMIVDTIFEGLLMGYPMTTDPSAWYAGYMVLALLAAGGMAAYGFKVSLQGRAAQPAVPERQSP